MNNNDAKETILFALESAVYLGIDNGGLSIPELKELCARFGFQEGQAKDAIDEVMSHGGGIMYFGDPFCYLKEDYLVFIAPWFTFHNDDPRNLLLLRSIIEFILEEIKKQGKSGFSLGVAFLINQLKDANTSENEIIRCLKILERYKLFKLQDDSIQCPGNMLNKDFISTIANSKNFRKNEVKFHKVSALVSEVISRRGTHKTISIDPLTSFEELFSYLKCEDAKGWWEIQVSEFKNIDHKRCCNLSIVASAALCEGALSFFAASPIIENLTMVKKIGSDPTRWNFSDLIDAACTGSRPLFAADLKRRLVDLNEQRKVIHPSFYMSINPRLFKIPDIRTEQAVTGTETVKILLRTIIEWVQVFKISTQS